MNRLNELADWVSGLTVMGSDGEKRDAIAAILRAATAETVGTEWGFSGFTVASLETGNSLFRVVSSFEAGEALRAHHADLAAARLAVADARKERDEANAKLRDREAELLRCRTHETAAAHELDCKLDPEERHEFKRTADSLAEAVLRVAELEREAEMARMRLVACGVLANCDTEESLARNSNLHLDYSCDAVSNCQEAARRQIYLLARNAALQRAIDEAVAEWDNVPVGGYVNTRCIIDILRPHATRREETKCSVCNGSGWLHRHELPDTADWDGSADDTKYTCQACDGDQTQPKPAPAAQNATPARQWSSTPPTDQGGKWWHARGHTNGFTGLVLVETPGEIDIFDAVPGNVYNLWLPYLDGDTEDTLPPLPNSSAPLTGSPPPNHSETPKSSPVTTRELVARLAKIVGDPMFHMNHGGDHRDALDAIIRDAKGGAE